MKRALKMHRFNACLRRTRYLEHNEFPSDDQLVLHLQAESLDHKVAIQALVDEDEVAPGWRYAFLYRERLGLSPGACRLLGEGDPPAPPVLAGNPFHMAWRNYVKLIFKKGFMSKLSCSPSVIFYVSENKTLASKEDRTYEGEASGRKLVLTFFEHVPGGLVQRVDKGTLGMKLQLLTLAEILLACGVVVPPDPERTTAATELTLEAEYQHLQVKRFSCTLQTEAPQVHTYKLDEEDDAEQALCMELAANDLTKMVLAKHLQRNESLGAEETLNRAWSLTLAELKARAAPLIPALAPLVLRGRGPGRGRGRGAVAVPPGRGRGRGRCRVG